MNEQSLETFFNVQVTNDFVLFPDHHLVLHLNSIPSVSMKNGGELLAITEQFQLQNIRCIHLWEDIWMENTELIKSRVMAMLGQSKRIHGRQTKVVKLDKPVLTTFLNQNHLQGSPTAKYKYGLVHKGSLVAAASFSAGRPMLREGQTYQSFELVRFANLHSHTVVGGLSKLLQHFIKEQKPDDIMTYADRDWSMGEGYQKLGFTHIGNTAPLPFWIHPKERLRYYSTRLPDHLSNEFKNQDAFKTIDSFMEAKGYVRIFNSGNLKYLLLINR
ncbi:PDDEXK family nuclease [Solitalea koreensis]|uniref:hypothetical protein n=1 Tax=Solitalea koreensis TaxID=543615 RepID=UPI00115AA917|nr:hypothetical protein [Solitalea koreensis]